MIFDEVMSDPANWEGEGRQIDVPVAVLRRRAVGLLLLVGGIAALAVAALT